MKKATFPRGLYKLSTVECGFQPFSEENAKNELTLAKYMVY